MSSVFPVGSRALVDEHRACLHQSITVKGGECGSGGYAINDIYIGEEVGSVAYDFILSETYAASTEVGLAAQRMKDRSPVEVVGRTVLYIVMIAERQNPIAPFHAYLASLPSEYDDAVCWTNEERSSFLGSTNLHGGAVHRDFWLRRCFDAFFPALTASHPSLFPAEVFTFSAFVWAHSAFSSRCFPHLLSVRPVAGTEPGTGTVDVRPPSAEPQGDVNPFGYSDGTPVGCMLPVVDVLNHRPNTPITWVRGAGRVSFVLSPTGGGEGWGERDRVVAVPAGSEVFNNYGPKSNEELVLGYGFALPSNEADTLSAVTRVRIGDGQLALARLACLASLPARHILTRAHPLPPSLLAAFRLATFAGEVGVGADAFIQRAALSAGLPGSAEPDTPALARAVHSLLLSPNSLPALQEGLACVHACAHFEAMRERLVGAHPWLHTQAADAGESALPVLVGPGFGPRSSYRRHISRLYIRGQFELITLAVGALHRAVESSAQPQFGGYVPVLVDAAPHPVCLGRLPSADAVPCLHTLFTLDKPAAGVWLSLVPSPGAPATIFVAASFPAYSVITPSTLRLIDPILAEALDATPGISLSITGSEEEEESKSSIDSLPLHTIHVALWLLRSWVGLGVVGGVASAVPSSSPQLDGYAAWAWEEASMLPHGLGKENGCIGERAAALAGHLCAMLVGGGEEEGACEWRQALGLDREGNERGGKRRRGEGGALGVHEQSVAHSSLQVALQRALRAAAAFSLPLPRLHPYAAGGEVELGLVPLWPRPRPAMRCVGAPTPSVGPTSVWCVSCVSGGDPEVQLRVAVPAGYAPARPTPSAQLHCMLCTVDPAYPSPVAAWVADHVGADSGDGAAGFMASVGERLPMVGGEDEGEEEVEGSTVTGQTEDMLVRVMLGY